MGRFQSPRYGPVEDLAYGTGTALNLRPMARYATAKLYAMMTAQELDRRLRSARSDASVPSVTVNSWSPGVVPTTQAGRDMPVVLKAIMTSSWFVRFMGSHLSTEGEAARALGRLVVSAELDGKSGLYFDGFEQILPSLESRDPEKARSVWEQSIALTRTHPRDPGSLTLEPPVPAGMDTA
jgi:hypothetical protein